MHPLVSTVMVGLLGWFACVACWSPPSTPDCKDFVAQSRPLVAVEGSWEIMLLARDGTESLLMVRIEAGDAGATAACGGAITLGVGVLSGDQRFSSAPISGCFKVTSCAGDGVLSLTVGDIALEATLKSDGTVVSNTSKSSDGTTVILGGGRRTRSRTHRVALPKATQSTPIQVMNYFITTSSRVAAPALTVTDGSTAA